VDETAEAANEIVSKGCSILGTGEVLQRSVADDGDEPVRKRSTHQQP
jgi:single-stranded DNA-binding protein